MAENTRPRTLYVGCSLTHAPEEFKAQVVELKAALRDRGYTVLEFLGLVDGTDADVYNQDILTNVDSCDAFIGVCDEPSIGLGYEMGRAATAGKPVLAVAHGEARVTRLVTGAAVVEKNVAFARYEDLVRDVPPMVDELFVAAGGVHTAAEIQPQ